MESKRLLQRLDWLLIIAVLAQCGIGLMVVASATRTMAIDGDPLFYVKRQVLWLALGMVLAVLTLAIDYHNFRYFSNVLYVGNLAVLGAVLKFGQTRLGAQRWIQIGPLPLQPSEVAKVILILTLANLLARKYGEWDSWWDMIFPLCHAALPMVLIMMQPDLGTSLASVAIVLGMLFVAGAPPKKLGILVGTAGGAVVGALFLRLKYGMWLPLKDYQIKRLLVFLNPRMDPLNSGYHIIQSLIAIGSGRFTGKGLFDGTQSRLAFLPYQHTDFIFSVVGEELGFVGGLVILTIYLVIIVRALNIASKAKDIYGSLIAAGVASMLAFHLFVNVGMTMGVMPVTGLPLPFVSYGGSSMLTTMVAVGLLLNVGARRHTIMF